MDHDLIEAFRQCENSSDLTPTERRVVLGAVAFTLLALVGTIVFALL